jgi:hypothetical protein
MLQKLMGCAGVGHSPPSPLRFGWAFVVFVSFIVLGFSRDHATTLFPHVSFVRTISLVAHASFLSRLTPYYFFYYVLSRRLGEERPEEE